VIHAGDYILVWIEIKDNDDPDAISEGLFIYMRGLLRKPCPLQCPGCREKNPNPSLQSVIAENFSLIDFKVHK
jgi:hypothetical protein